MESSNLYNAKYKSSPVLDERSDDIHESALNTAVVVVECERKWPATNRVVLVHAVIHR